MAGEGDGGEMELLPSIWKRKRKGKGQASMGSKVSGLLLEHCQVIDSLALRMREQSCSHSALFFFWAKALEGE